MQQNQDIVVHAVLDEYSEETITHQYRSLQNHYLKPTRCVWNNATFGPSR